MRKLGAAYWLLLTLLLFSRHPSDWLSNPGGLGALYGYLDPIAHFLAFAVLGVMVLATHWPVRRLWMLAILALYSAATELVQSQIPGRSMQLVDLLQDFAGLLVGAAVVYLTRRFCLSRRLPSPASDGFQRPRRRNEVPLAMEPVPERLIP